MVMLCTPAAKADVWNVVLPLLSVPVPRLVAPSRKLTVAVGIPKVADTVPVKVTACPTSTVVAEEVTDEVVLDLVGGGLPVELLYPPQPTRNRVMPRTSNPSTLQRLRLLLKLPARIMLNTPIPFRFANNMVECEFP